MTLGYTPALSVLAEDEEEDMSDLTEQRILPSPSDTLASVDIATTLLDLPQEILLQIIRYIPV